MNNRQRLLRIETDGSVPGTKVFLNDEQVPGVQKVETIIDISGTSTVSLTLDGKYVQYEIIWTGEGPEQAELDAAITEIKSWLQ